MKISRHKLEEIIEETVSEFLDEAALCHDEKGHFSKCDAGATYSLSKSGAEEAGVDKKYVGRGKVSRRGKRKDGSYSLSSKMGMNTSSKKQAGRTKFPDGEEIDPKYSVSKYPQRYKEEKTVWNPDWKSAKKRKQDHSILKPSHTSWNHGHEELSQVARGVGLGILEGDGNITYQQLLQVLDEAFPIDELEEATSPLRKKCRSMGLISMSEAQKRILLSLNAFAKAHDGKLGDNGQS